MHSFLFLLFRYKKRMLSIKVLYDDKPQDMLKNIIWWTEYVIRHKGNIYFQTSIVHESWYTRYDMDVIAILSIALFIVSVCVLIIIYKLLKPMILKYLWRETSIDIKKKSS